MWQRIASDDDKAAHGARAELQTLWLNALGALFKLALDKTNSSAKQWAGMMLASIFVSINKHDSEKGKARRELSNINGAYREGKRRLGKVRTDVLLAAKIGAIVWRELKIAQRYCNRLLLLKAACVSEREQKRLLSLKFECGRTWKQASREQGISQEYWQTVKLPEFSKKSQPDWWKFLWPLISRKINVSRLPSLTQRDPETGGVKSRKRYLSDYQHTALGALCKHLLA